MASRSTTPRPGARGSRDGESYEFNIIAHDGEEVVIVEVKTTLRVRRVEKFIERLHRAKRYLPEYGTQFGPRATAPPSSIPRASSPGSSDSGRIFPQRLSKKASSLDPLP